MLRTRHLVPDPDSFHLLAYGGSKTKPLTCLGRWRYVFETRTENNTDIGDGAADQQKCHGCHKTLPQYACQIRAEQCRERTRKGKNKENAPPPNTDVEVTNSAEDEREDGDHRPVSEMDLEAFIATLESVQAEAFHSLDRANDLSRMIWEHMRYRWM